MPNGSELEIEAYVETKDIGLEAGQPAIVKIEFLPFTRYGVLAATVVRVAMTPSPSPTRSRSRAIRPKPQNRAISVVPSARRTRCSR